jgi:type I restriction enzyme S subunit
MGTESGYKRTEIGEIPKEWRAEILSNVVEVNPKRSLLVDREYPFIPMDALSDNLPMVTYVEKRIWNRSSGSKFQTGDVLLARITPSAENGKTALVEINDDDGKGFGSTEFIVLSTKTGGIEDPRFLYHVVKFDAVRKQAIQRMTGSTGRQRIPPEAFDDILCPIPTVVEQQEIASILSTVDDVIQKTDEIISATQQLKKGLMQQLLTKGIGHTKFKQTGIGEIPEEWEFVPGNQLFKLVSGYAPAAIKFGHQTSDAILYVKVDDMNDPRNERFIVASELVLSKTQNPDIMTYTPGTIVFPKRGAAILGNKVRILGREAIFDTNVMGLVCNPDLDENFFRYQLEHFGLYRLLENAGIPQLNNKHLYPFKFKRPPLVEQRKIASILSDFENKIDTEKQTRAHLERLKKGLMQVLLTGKVRVRVN